MKTWEREGSRCGKDRGQNLPRLWASARKRLVVPQREEWRKQEVWEGEHEAKVLFSHSYTCYIPWTYHESLVASRKLRTRESYLQLFVDEMR